MLRGGGAKRAIVPGRLNISKSKRVPLFALNMLPVPPNEILPRGSELLDKALVKLYYH